MEKLVTPKEFNEAKTFADAEGQLNKMAKCELLMFVKCHEYVKSTTGLDMRQEMYLDIAKAIVKAAQK